MRLLSKPRRLQLATVALLFFLTTLSATQQAPLADSLRLQLDLARKQWSVQILRPTSLHTVLEAICAQARLSCDLNSGLQDTVPPMLVQGSAAEVVSQLMDGIKANYSFLEPGAQGGGALIVLPPAPAVSAAVAAPEPAQPVPEAAMTAPETATAVNDAAVLPAEPENASQSEAAEPSDNAETADNEAGNGGAQTLPFIGGDGNLIVRPAGGQASNNLSPFLDGHGNLAPIPSMEGQAANQLSPFIGSNGSLVPIPNQGGGNPALSPFPDSHGNLLPLPPGNGLPRN